MLTVDELRQINLFENLDEKELQQLLSISTKKVFSKGEVLFYEKEKAKYLTIVLEGIVKIYKVDSKNNEIVIHRFKPTNMVAEMAVFEEIPYPASAAFESDGSVVQIDFDAFTKHFFTNKDVAFSLFKSLVKKIKNLDNVISLNLLLDSTERVAKYICEHDEALKMKNKELAQYLHMTPETLSRILKKFTKLGFVKKENSSYKVVNKEALEVLFE